MAEGKEISEHTSSKEGSILVLEGDGIFNLEGKDIKMEKGVFIHMAANAKHSLKANKNTSFILTLIKGDLI
jgi:quercetin dioxygenase-like cupin family protein